MVEVFILYGKYLFPAGTVLNANILNRMSLGQLSLN